MKREESKVKKKCQFKIFVKCKDNCVCCKKCVASGLKQCTICLCLVKSNFTDSKYKGGDRQKRSMDFVNQNNKKPLWSLFMDGIQLPQGQSNFEEAVYFSPLSSQKFLVLILSTWEGETTEATFEPPSGFEHRTPIMGIKCLNNQATAP